MRTANPKLSIVMAAAECAPFARVGGLGDVIGSLPKALAKEGIQVSVLLPKYGFISERRFGLKKIAPAIVVEEQEKKIHCALYSASGPGPVRYFFLELPDFSGKTIYRHAWRKRLVGNAYTRSSSDVLRFSLFSKAVVEAIHQAAIPCDIIHCHDWHTAFVPIFADELAVTKSYRYIKTVFTIHNLGNQGVAYREYIQRLGLAPDATPPLMEDYYDVDDARLNAMKLGILSSDAITTVSPTYAKQILTKEYGAGLESYLLRRKKDIHGVINGIDATFDPRTDPSITNYSIRNFDKGKSINKKSLQRFLGLRVRELPLYGAVNRLVAQKGFDILVSALRVFLKKDVQVVILGSGDPAIEKKITTFARKYPHTMAVRIGFDARLAQRIYAASDFFLMPSRYEPCGLGQLIAMRYGAVPIVRATGGLIDTVHHGKTGIIFKAFNAQALRNALAASLQLYRNKKNWYTMVERCMRQDFSWQKSARVYVKLYQELLR